MTPVIRLLLLLAAAACAGGGEAPTASTAVDSAFTVGGRPVPPALLNGYVARHEGFTSRGGAMRCAYTPLGQEDDRLFVYTLCLELVREGDSLAAGSGRGGPVALRVVREGDSVRVASHEVPADGGGQAASIRRIFPGPVAQQIFAPAAFHIARVDTLQAHLRAEAAARAGLDTGGR